MNVPDMPRIDPARIESNWRAINAELDAPQPSRVERWLRLAGFPPEVTRLVVATPALRRAWFLSLGVAVVVGLGAAQPGDRASLLALLMLAPAIPVLGVALAYGPSADPLYEAQLATPMRGIRLVVVRAATVLTVSVAIVVPLALLTPAARGVAALWLLPALGLTMAALALMTVLSPRRAGVVVAGGWFAIVLVARGVGDDALAAFGAGGQVGAVLVAIVGGVVLMVRRDHFDRDHGELAT